MTLITNLAATLAAALAEEALTTVARLFPSTPPGLVEAQAATLRGVPGGIVAGDYTHDELDALHPFPICEWPAALVRIRDGERQARLFADLLGDDGFVAEWLEAQR